MSDVKTLRLASFRLTASSLEAFVTYQRTLMKLLAQTAPGADETWAGRFAFAHARALAESTLDALDQQRLKVLVGEYCGRRSAVRTIDARAAEAQRAVDEATTKGHSPQEKDLRILERARAELPRLNDLSAFSQRYGADATALLAERDAELVALHQSLVRLEGSGGHLHPA